MRIVIALGGNALLRKGEPLTAKSQRKNVRIAAQAIAPLTNEHEIIISHGNGPQVGLLALQSNNGDGQNDFPLDVLGAQTEGMIGYMIEQELGNILPFEQPFATILTMVEVDKDDPAFKNPTKPIGPYYSEKEAEELKKLRGWSFKKKGEKWRRVVPSPLPRRIFELRPIHWLLEKGTIVICAGGGGIPTIYDQNGKLVGADVVIDKDYAGALLAQELDADLFVMATATEGVYANWGNPNAELIREITPEGLRNYNFEEGSMAPKIAAGCWFVNKTCKDAVIGSLSDLPSLVAGNSGTRITAVK